MNHIITKDLPPNDQQLFKKRKDGLSIFELTCCYLNSMIGTGMLKLGSGFRCGVGLAMIMNLIFAVLYFFSMVIFVKVSGTLRCSTFEEIWIALFGKKTAIICAMLSLLCAEFVFMFYVQSIQDTFKNVFLFLFGAGSVSNELISPITISLLFFVIFCIPNCYCANLKIVVIMAYCDIVCIAFFLVHTLYWMIFFIKDHGFDPNHEIKIFDFNSSFTTCLSSLSTAYLLFPLAWPSIRHMKHPTTNNWYKVLFLVFTICFILYSTMGIASYFTFFDTNEGGLILDYYPASNLVSVANIFVGLLIIFTTPMVLNPARYILINMVFITDNISQEVWFITGIILVFIGISIANMAENIVAIFTVISDVLGGILGFILPAVFYMKTFGKKEPWFLAISILLLFVGIGLVAFFLFLDLA